MNEDMLGAAEHALAASMQAFQERVVVASGIEMQAQAVILTWQMVTDLVYQHMIQVGLNPLAVSKEDVGYLIEEVGKELDNVFGDGDQWTMIVGPLIKAALLKTNKTAEVVTMTHCPNCGQVICDASTGLHDLLAHESDCPCSKCEGGFSTERRLERIEDSHLEAAFEDRVCGNDWDF